MQSLPLPESHPAIRTICYFQPNESLNAFEIQTTLLPFASVLCPSSRAAAAAAEAHAAAAALY